MPRKRRPSEIVSGELYARMLAHNDGACHVAGCGGRPGTRALPVDHDHRTGRIRGLLCHTHNRRLWPTATPAELGAMADYLEANTEWGHL